MHQSRDFYTAGGRRSVYRQKMSGRLGAAPLPMQLVGRPVAPARLVNRMIAVTV